MIRIGLPTATSDEEKMEALLNSSMHNWLYKVMDLPINTPETVEVVDSPNLVDELGEIAESMGRFYLRGEYLSANPYWQFQCHLRYSGDRLRREIQRCINVIRELEGSHRLSSRYFYIRRYIEPVKIFDVDFSGGGDAPVKTVDRYPINLEVRVYIDLGRILAYTPYWTIDRIHRMFETTGYRLPRDWRQLYRERYRLSNDDVEMVMEMASQIAEEFHGGWAIDFLKGLDGRWYMIEMEDLRIAWRPRTDELIWLY